MAAVFKVIKNELKIIFFTFNKQQNWGTKTWCFASQCVLFVLLELAQNWHLLFII